MLEMEHINMISVFALAYVHTLESNQCMEVISNLSFYYKEKL